MSFLSTPFTLARVWRALYYVKKIQRKFFDEYTRLYINNRAVPLVISDS